MDIGGYRSPQLSRREVEVVRTWLLVSTKDDVCQRLFLSLGTVNSHMSRVRRKYEAVGRSAPTKANLVARALQDGYVALHEL